MVKYREFTLIWNHLGGDGIILYLSLFVACPITFCCNTMQKKNSSRQKALLTRAAATVTLSSRNNFAPRLRSLKKPSYSHPITLKHQDFTHGSIDNGWILDENTNVRQRSPSPSVSLSNGVSTCGAISCFSDFCVPNSSQTFFYQHLRRFGDAQSRQKCLHMYVTERKSGG